MDGETLKSRPSVGWPKTTTWLDRINICISMLSIHGFLTDSERQRVRDRINKALGKKDGDS
jgi:hypothetical protein